MTSGACIGSNTLLGRLLSQDQVPSFICWKRGNSKAPYEVLSPHPRHLRSPLLPSSPFTFPPPLQDFFPLSLFDRVSCSPGWPAFSSPLLRMTSCFCFLSAELQSCTARPNPPGLFGESVILPCLITYSTFL